MNPITNPLTFYTPPPTAKAPTPTHTNYCPPQALDLEMASALGEVSAVIFFLLGAMTVVEVVDSHQGFKVGREGAKLPTPTKLRHRIRGRGVGMAWEGLGGRQVCREGCLCAD